MIKYINGNLFDASKDTLLVHSISSDARMGAGIAKQFAKIYPIDLNQMRMNHRQGMNLVGTNYYSVTSDDRHDVCHMFAKPIASNKPEDHEGLYSCLDELKDFVVERGYKKIAMPLIGSGLDAIWQRGINGRDWKDISQYIETIFEHCNVEIYVYYL